MRLAPMRYKEFTWPHNPETYQVEHRRQVAVHKVPFGGYVLQDLGAGCRVLLFPGRGGFFRPGGRSGGADGAGDGAAAGAALRGGTQRYGESGL